MAGNQLAACQNRGHRALVRLRRATHAQHGQQSLPRVPQGHDADAPPCAVSAPRWYNPTSSPVGQRYTKYESTFRELGVQVSGAQYIGRPRWGHPWHGGSFAKLFALALANFSKVLVLDSDCVVLRNIDHMAVFPAPSFRFQTVRVGNECQWELQSGVMVLEPDALEYERAIRLTTSLKSRPPGSDGGDQSVWRILYERVHELPAAYNAFKYELNGSENWASVFVLHDGWNMRWSRWWPDAYPAHGRLLADLTANASDLMVRAANFSLATPRSLRSCYHQELSRRPTRVVYICDWKNLTPSTHRAVAVPVARGSTNKQQLRNCAANAATAADS